MPARPSLNMVWSSASSTLISPLVVAFVFRSSSNTTRSVPLVLPERHCTVYTIRTPDLRLFDIVRDIPTTVRPASSSGIHRSAWKGDSPKFALPAFRELRPNGVLRSYHARIGKRLTRRRRHMPLLRVEETNSGGFTVLNLQMVTRLKCASFDGRQQEHRASVFFADGGTVELAGTDADRVLNAMEDFADYHRS